MQPHYTVELSGCPTQSSFTNLHGHTSFLQNSRCHFEMLWNGNGCCIQGHYVHSVMTKGSSKQGYRLGKLHAYNMSNYWLYMRLSIAASDILL